jgi:hypothetical protein
MANWPAGVPLILPQQRVQNVARHVEREIFLELPDVVEVTAAACVVELVQRVIGALHVSRVMCTVVQLHDLARQQRLERVGPIR